MRRVDQVGSVGESCWGAFTGVCQSDSCVDAELLGNVQDYFLKSYYVTQLNRDRNTDAQARSRARKAGNEPPPQCGARVAELGLQVYKCKFGEAFLGMCELLRWPSGTMP